MELALYKDALSSIWNTGLDQLRALAQTRMRVFLVSSLALVATVLGQSSVVDNYVKTQSPIAKAGVLANIGPDGSKCHGAKVRPRLHMRISFTELCLAEP